MLCTKHSWRYYWVFREHSTRNDKFTIHLFFSIYVDSCWVNDNIMQSWLSVRVCSKLNGKFTEWACMSHFTKTSLFFLILEFFLKETWSIILDWTDRISHQMIHKCECDVWIRSVLKNVNSFFDLRTVREEDFPACFLLFVSSQKFYRSSLQSSNLNPS